jgi:hypothetical protein
VTSSYRFGSAICFLKVFRPDGACGRTALGRREAPKGSAQPCVSRGRPVEDNGTRNAGHVLSVVAGMLLGVLMLALPVSANADEPYGVETFSNQTTDLGGAPYAMAGGHPDLNTTSFSIPRSYDGTGSIGVEQLNGTYVTLPHGFIGNPAAAPRCPLSKIPDYSHPVDTCPQGSRIGIIEFTWNPTGEDAPNSSFATSQFYPIYNLPPERGFPAQFGFKLNFGPGPPTVLSAFTLPRADSYGLTVATPNIPAVNTTAVGVIFCANGVEGEGNAVGSFKCKSPSGSDRFPFLSNPVDCSEADPTWSIAIDSLEHAGALRALGIPDLSDPDWKTATDPAPPVTGCDALVFDPSLAVDPLQPGGGPAQADQPTGLRVALDFPQTNDPTDTQAESDPAALQTPPPKDITVKLPGGVAISPSSADGLQGCSDQASDPSGDQVHYDNTKPVQCPDASKIGTATALSPLLALHEPEDPEDEVIGPDPIPGDVYLLKPHPGDLPIGGDSDGKFRLLIELENPRYGVNIKLPGVATADKQTGQLTTVFTQNPQLPASHLTVDLKQGPRAPLMTPVICGKYETNTTMVPWGTPDVPDAHPTADFSVASGPGGSGCVSTPAQRPFSPALSAGTESAKAGSYSPFNLHLTRNDGEQEFSSLEATLPKGLAAKFVGIPYCPDAVLAAAAARTGKAEQSNPSCPASRLGSVTVGAGPGSSPLYTGGTAYLAGPYKGAPMSVAVITPAVAGPFDLGTVIVRNALYVDPETAQGRVVSDPFPNMLDGIPLKLRSIDVNLDRSTFTLNPTNCSPLSINATLTSTDGATAKPTNYFQAGRCNELGFKPDLKLSLKGATKRSGHPALKAVLNYPKGNYANIAKAVVSLPHSEFLAQNHIKTICTRVQFAADQCPKGSIYGFATATTPLLDAPLSGPVYLRSSSNPLPDLVAALHGQIDIDLVGRIDSKNGGIRTTFDAVPDAPVSKFVLTMQGGKKGLLENSKNLCNSVNKADVKFTAQNGMTSNSKPVLTNSCKKAKKGKGAKKGKAKGHKRTIAWLPNFGF